MRRLPQAFHKVSSVKPRSHLNDQSLQDILNVNHRITSHEETMLCFGHYFTIQST